MGLERSPSRDLAQHLFGADDGRTLILIRALWPGAVGPALAGRTEVVTMESRTLRIRVPGPAWRSVLHRMQPAILARLRETAGDLAPRRLSFMEGPLSSRSEPVPDGPLPPDDPGLPPSEVAEAAAQIDDPDVRQRFLESATRYLSRASRGS